LVKREWPNYFRLNAVTAAAEQLLEDISREVHNDRYELVNKDGARLYKLCKADLVGLIADCAETPHADNRTTVDADDARARAEGSSEVYKVSMEIDFLERALSFRASLRATAASILQQIAAVGPYPPRKPKSKAAQPITAGGLLLIVVRLAKIVTRKESGVGVFWQATQPPFPVVYFSAVVARW
jgi:hypothetical protein